MPAETLNSLKVESAVLGTSPTASWETTERFLTDPRVTTRPIEPTSERRDQPHSLWPPKAYDQTNTGWVRQFEILGRYGSGMTDLFKKDPIPRQRAWEVRKMAILALHQSLSEEIQSEYPLQELGTVRPIQKVEQEIEKPLSVPQIRQALRMSEQEAEALTQEGIKNGLYDNKQIQSYLDSLTTKQIALFLRGENPFLDHLGRLAKEAEISNTTGRKSVLKDIAAKLKDLGIPVAISKPYFDDIQNYEQIYRGVLHEDVPEGKEHSIVTVLKGPEFDSVRNPTSGK